MKTNTSNIIKGTSCKCGYSIETLAKQCRIPVSTLYYKMRTETLNVSELRRIAVVTGMSNEDILQIIKGERG